MMRKQTRVTVEKADRHSFYKKNGMNHVKCGVYLDFTLFLLDTIFETYMGDDVTDNKDKYRHYEWCWRRATDTFKGLGFDFTENKQVLNYIGRFMNSEYYSKEKTLALQGEIKAFWNLVFGDDATVSLDDLALVRKIYLLFDK